MRCRTVLVSSLLLLPFLAASAQPTAKAQLSYKLISIRVKGLNHLREDQIVTASGLKLGQTAGQDDFKRALQKLGDTGLFTNLSYAYRDSTDGCNLDIQVTENDKLLPILFDNFVWFSDEQLITLLRARVPLFDGRLPEAGNLADQVSDALNALLAGRKIAGKADYLRSGALNGPIDSYTYKITFHAVVIRNLNFPGAAPGELPALQAAAKPLSGQEFLRSKMRPQEKFNFLPVYRSRGFLTAKFDDALASIVSDGPRTLVDVSLPVHPGIQYKLEAIAWAGNSAIPSDKLQSLVHLKPGELANAVQLDEDLEAVQKLYGTKGYLSARVLPAPTLDDSQATVSYRLNVVEGDQYRMGDLQIDGVDQSAINRIMAQWQLKKGDPYDNTYAKRFFQFTYRDTTLSRSYNIAQKETPNPQDKTVTLAIHFVPK
ncbi:MAG TPA: POTRA domain-containing protein [Terriglobales bacterium]